MGLIALGIPTPAATSRVSTYGRLPDSKDCFWAISTYTLLYADGWSSKHADSVSTSIYQTWLAARCSTSMTLCYQIKLGCVHSVNVLLFGLFSLPGRQLGLHLLHSFLFTFSCVIIVAATQHRILAMAI